MKKIRIFFIAAFVMMLILPFLSVSEKKVYADPATERTGTPAATSADNSPMIRNFSVRETGNGIYRAEWDIDNVTDTVYIRIYASQDKSGFEGTLVQEIESGTHGAVDVYMPDIDSGYYSLYLEAASPSGIAGYKYSDNFFFYDNTNRQDKLTDITMCPEEKDLFLMWNGDMPASILLYDSESGDLVQREDGFYSPCSVSLPKGHKGFLIGVASFEGGILGRFDPVDSKTLKISDAAIRMPAEEVTGKSEADISVDCDSEYTLKIFKNGSLIEANASASDRYTVPLDEGGNDLIVFLTDADGKMRAAEALVDVDTIEPELVLIGQTDDVRTVDEEITLKGYVDEDAVLKYLGEEVELAGGNFYLRKPLGFGKNQFTLTAQDAAGNTTEKTVTVERVFWSQKNILIILLAISVVSVTVIELFLLFFRSDRKRRTGSEKTSAASSGTSGGLPSGTSTGTSSGTSTGTSSGTSTENSFGASFGTSDGALSGTSSGASSGRSGRTSGGTSSGMSRSERASSGKPRSAGDMTRHTERHVRISEEESRRAAEMLRRHLEEEDDDED